MSLLMEALRKAEEAKRQAAQKDNAESQPAASASPAADAVPVAAIPTADATMPELDFPELTLDMPSVTPAATSSLDIPFDFQIDPDLHVQADPAPEQSAALSLHEPDMQSESPRDLSADDALSFVSPAMSESPAEPAPTPVTGRSGSALSMVDLSLEPEIEYISPHTLRQLATPAESEKPASSGLSLAEAEADAAQERPAFIADAETIPHVLEEAPGAGSVEEEHLDAAPAALAVAVTAQAATAAPVDERPRVRVETLRATDENRIRESARAVFNAKTGNKGGKWSRARIMALAAVVVLLPLGGGAYWYVQQMLTPSVQFNVSPEAIEAARQASLAQETQPVPDEVTLALSDQAVVPDSTSVTQETAPVDSPEPDLASTPGAAVAQEDAAVAVEEPVVDIATSVDPIEQVPATAIADSAAPTPLLDTPDDASVVGEPALEQAQPAESVPALAQSAALPAATPASTAEPINIIRNDNAPAVNAQLASAYAAFQDQDYFAARSLYQQALRELPNNRDALLGLAAVSVQLGDVSTARELYSRLLQLDPRDVLARVGLLDSMPLGDSVQTETQLLSLKSEHPEIAQLSFALGNFYAGQRRWNEAQAAYYDALLAAKAQSGSAVSPDFAFNLAVSLDRLNQAEPAYNFYREALEQSRTVNPGFDLRILRDRLDSLERQLP